MPYVSATVLEIQRLSFTPPSTLPHRITEDVEYTDYNGSNYVIPKGSFINSNLRKFLMDPEVFPEPHKFR